MGEIVIETKQLTKQYGTQKSVAELNIHVQRGRIYGLLGRNGAGKTTTMKMLLGLTQPTSGNVTIWGKSLMGNEKKLLPRIGSLIESPGFYPNLTATENLRIFIRALCDERGKTILISSHILSEVALLADDIGIIDHGVLLEEESLSDLEAKSERYIRFTISDTERAAEVLNGVFHENQFAVQDGHHLRLDSAKVPVAKIVSAFVQYGLEVSEAAIVEESLEDYFKRVTGGEGIA